MLTWASWISGLFALEYSGLFRVLVPFLARTRMPIPLGGTSNHFQRPALETVGGWDPHNVTEDADLGLRLYAHGYRTGVRRQLYEPVRRRRQTCVRNQVRFG